MTLHLYQIVIVAVSGVMIFEGVSRFVKGKSGQTFLKLFIRVAVWGGMSLIALFPGFTNFLAKIIGIQDNINAVILTGFILIFLMIFKLLSAIERLEQSLSEVTRKESLSKITANSYDSTEVK